MTDTQNALNYLKIKNTGYIKRFRAIRFGKVEVSGQVIIMIIADASNFQQLAQRDDFLGYVDKGVDRGMTKFYFKINDITLVGKIKHFVCVPSGDIASVEVETVKILNLPVEEQEEEPSVPQVNIEPSKSKKNKGNKAVE
jgi:hypothetical protein